MAHRKTWHELEGLGQRIRKARERLGLTQSSLAELIGKNQDTISGYEHGSRAIRVTELPALAKALQVPIGYFFGYDNPNAEAMDLLRELQTMPSEEQRKVIDRWRVELEWWRKHTPEINLQNE